MATLSPTQRTIVLLAGIVAGLVTVLFAILFGAALALRLNQPMHPTAAVQKAPSWPASGTVSGTIHWTPPLLPTAEVGRVVQLMYVNLANGDVITVSEPSPVQPDGTFSFTGVFAGDNFFVELMPQPANMDMAVLCFAPKLFSVAATGTSQVNLSCSPSPYGVD